MPEIIIALISKQQNKRRLLRILASCVFAWAVFVYFRANRQQFPFAPSITEDTIEFSVQPVSPITPQQTRKLRFINSAAGTATTLSPISVTTQTQLPAITRDLLFESEQGVMRWNHSTGKIENLIPKAAHQYSSQQRIVRINFPTYGESAPLFITQYKIASRGVGQYDLYLYNGKEQLLTKVLANVPEIVGIDISPDGEWLTYALRTMPPVRQRSWLSTWLHRGPCGCGELPVTGMIYALRLNSMTKPIELGPCSEETIYCSSLRIRPATDHTIYDPHKTWFVRYDGSNVQLTAQRTTSGEDELNLHLLSSAPPLSHYSIVWLLGQSHDSFGVLDHRNRIVSEIPNTIESNGRQEFPLWLSDGRFLLVRPIADKQIEAPRLEIWSLDQSDHPRLNIDETWKIPSQSMSRAAFLTRFEDGRVGFALFSTNQAADSERGLYWLDVDHGTLARMNSLPRSVPPVSGVLYWSPDGTGLIYKNFEADQRLIWYIPTDGSAPYDLGQIVKGYPGDFIWIPMID